MNMSFYKFMNILDEFTIENKDLDFRELEMKCNKIMDNEQVFIKNKDGKVIKVITLNKELE